VGTIKVASLLAISGQLLTVALCGTDFLAAHPRAGDMMEGTGGIRKLRWARGGKGKSGGVRVIYYYHDHRIPLYLLTVFGKSEQSNITKSERNELAKLVGLLVQVALEREHV
jgi:hypothetical protein